jgi:hypothetical protein
VSKHGNYGEYVDFDEKRFDIDEYEQRLQRFEEYL